MNKAGSMADLRCQLEVMLWRYGSAWVVAVLLLGAAAAVHVATRIQTAPAIDRLRSDPEATRPQGPVARDRPPQTGLAELHAQSQSSHAVVAAMNRLAAEHGFDVAQAEYHHQPSAHGGMMQLQVLQPVRATYPQLRGYVEAVLLAIPNASLDHLAARRELPGQPLLEGRLKWTVWVTRQTADSQKARSTP